MANPTLNEKVFSSFDSLESDQVMTNSGAMTKTCILGLLAAITFAYNWSLILSGMTDKATLLSTVGIIGGFITCLIICFGPKNKFLPISTSIYAMCEGLALGYLSAIANLKFPGVASQAAIATLLAVFGMFIIFKTGVIRVTNTVMSIIMNCTFAILGIYLIQIICSFFHIGSNALFSNSTIGLAFSIFCVAVATFNLLLDFNLIERCSNNAPKYMEWYCGFSLLVTIIWMYIEILRLLMKLQSRN